MPYRPYQYQQQPTLDPFDFVLNQQQPRVSPEDWDQRKDVLTRLGLADGLLGDANQLGHDAAVWRTDTKDKVRNGLMKFIGL